nr:transposase family protein [Streptomyces sp. Act143]
MLVQPSAVDLSTAHPRHLSCELEPRRRDIGTRWQRPTAGRQALLALARLRCGDSYAQLAAGFGIGVATGYPLCPRGERRPDRARADGRRRDGDGPRKGYVILDGSVLPLNRVAADRPSCSGGSTASSPPSPKPT